MFAGVSGTFLGGQHQYLAILGNDAATISVYDLARAGPNPAAALVLDAAATGALNVFSGPEPGVQPAYVLPILFLAVCCQHCQVINHVPQLFAAC